MLDVTYLFNFFVLIFYWYWFELLVLVLFDKYKVSELRNRLKPHQFLWWPRVRLNVWENNKLINLNKLFSKDTPSQAELLVEAFLQMLIISIITPEPSWGITGQSIKIHIHFRGIFCIGLWPHKNVLMSDLYCVDNDFILKM